MVAIAQSPAPNALLSEAILVVYEWPRRTHLELFLRECFWAFASLYWVKRMKNFMAWTSYSIVLAMSFMGVTVGSLQFGASTFGLVQAFRGTAQMLDDEVFRDDFDEEESEPGAPLGSILDFDSMETQGKIMFWMAEYGYFPPTVLLDLLTNAGVGLILILVSLIGMRSLFAANLLLLLSKISELEEQLSALLVDATED